MKRNLQDKSKFGIGPLHRVVFDGSPLNVFYNTPFYNQTGGILLSNYTQSAIGGTISEIIGTVNIPNFDFDIDVNFTNVDNLKIIARNLPGSVRGNVPILTNTDAIDPIGDSSTSKYLFAISNYETHLNSNIWSNIQRIKKSWRVDRPKPAATTVPIDNANLLTFPYINGTKLDLATEWRSAGNKTTLISSNENVLGVSSTLFSYLGGVPAVEDNSIDLWLVSYERYNNNQYGGNLRTSRYGNEYISTGHFQPYNLDDVIGYKEVWGGDTNVQYYGYTKFEKNYQTETSKPTGLPNTQQPNSDVRRRIFFFAPCECSNLNIDLAQGARANRFSMNNAGDVAQGLFEDYVFNSAYSQEQFINRYFSKFFNQTDVIEEPHNIYITEPKFDNQRIDSWRFFRVNNTLGVDGNFGPINKIIEQNGKLIFLQEDAVGLAAINERIIINEGDTSALTLGTGQPLQRSDYLSTETGTIHQHSVEKTGSGVYHYDSKLQKIMITSFSKDGAGTISLSDQLGLSSFLRNNINGNIKNTDKLLLEERYGVHTIYHPEHAQVYFTFIMNNDYVTITYNEYLKVFDSFHNLPPSMYLNTRYGLYAGYFNKNTPLSNHSDIHQLNAGDRNIYFNVLHPSSVKILSNENPDFLKRWDNLYVNTEVYNNLNENVLESLTRVRFTNDYQDSGLITFNVNAELVPKLRVWRFNKLRDTQLNQRIQPRLSDKYITTDLIYDNPNNRRLVLHDILMEYSSRSTLNNTIK